MSKTETETPTAADPPSPPQSGDSTDPDGATGLALVKDKLFTKEDPMHYHKIIGVLCLASFAWRLTDFTPRHDMHFKTHPGWTIPTLVLHLALNLSSLIFEIPKMRIKTGGRIWPEYRLHNLVFSGRCLACIALNYYEKTHRIPINYFHSYIVVMATMLSADSVSNSVKYQSNSIRDLDTMPLARYFFSSIQFLGTSAALVRYKQRSAMFFFNLFVVQLTAFTMTLQRKNLVSHNAIVAFYGVQLAYAVYAGFNFIDRDFGLVRLVGFGAALWRMYIPYINNKYLIWTVMYIWTVAVLVPSIRNDPLAPMTGMDVNSLSNMVSLVMVFNGARIHVSWMFRNMDGNEKKDKLVDNRGDKVSGPDTTTTVDGAEEKKTEVGKQD